ncbi:unnamed protein product [Cuscuta europaea]|uniref:Replication factor A C-terminal domain-containing protein n=1 Tax=Cuscuta europaea TaxID=41803 RepID=A0A9P0VRC6_CUSEU|nr:unnamed protein product [Cuscuta europaea]
MGVSTSYNASKVLLNVNVPDIEEFRTRMLDMGSSQSLSSTSSQPALSDDKEVGIVKMLSELQTTKEVRGLWFYGKINAILNATSWAYMGCFKRSCRARAIKCDNEFECTKCRVRSSEENWLYKLKLNVVHGCRNAELLFWDQAWKQFLGKPTSDFREHLDDVKLRPHSAPPLFYDLVGREYLFKIERDIASLDGSDAAFCISMTTDNKEKIEQIKSSWKDEAEPETEYNSDSDLDLILEPRTTVESNLVSLNTHNN